MLAGELHNSSLSSAAHMSTVWPNMRAMHVNTLLGSVTWEMIEPKEGHFDFRALDEVLAGARQHGMHLVLLWFGSFKNALSTYAPTWVKRDVERFPRVHVREAGGRMRTLELVQPWNPRAWEADARAFAALMGHLREVDSVENTVIMVQVENETGLLGDSRDGSRVADVLYEQTVPREVISHLKKEYHGLHAQFRRRWPNLLDSPKNPTWEEAFGVGVEAEEMFMAHAFSTYIGHVSKAGKAQYDIPMYTNVWLNMDDPTKLDLEGIPDAQGVVGGGIRPGVYPSGGPCPHTIDLWKFNAPNLDFISPDLYMHDYEDICQKYRHQNQPLFIPEQKRDEKGLRRTWLAYGSYQAMGCSPFGIDSLEAATSPVTRHYRLLDSMSKHILDAQAQRPDDMMGFYFDEVDETKKERSWVKVFGEFEVTVKRAFVFGKPGPGAGMIIRQPTGKFLLLGWGFNVSFKSVRPGSTFTGILYAEEKIVDAEGNLHTGRVMNGDETRSGEFFIMPNEDPDYGGVSILVERYCVSCIADSCNQFPIAVTIPAKTMIAEVEPYSVQEV